MAERVAGDRFAFPAAVNFAFWFQPGVETEIMKQAVGVEPVKIVAIGPHRLKKRGRT